MRRQNDILRIWQKNANRCQLAARKYDLAQLFKKTASYKLSQKILPKIF